MPARLFHCTIINSGDGPLTFVNQNLDGGEFSDGLSPSDAPKVIEAGQSVQFEAQSDGFMTGTEGSAKYTAQVEDPEIGLHTEYFKISWDVPYVETTTDVTTLFTPERARYDMDLPHDSFEWQGRDSRPARLQWGFALRSVDTNFVETLQDTPAIFVEAFGSILSHLVDPGPLYLGITISGIAAEESTKIPGFVSTTAGNLTPVPLHDSSLNQWAGIWESAHVTAQIEVVNGLLNVTVQQQTTRGTRTIIGQQVVMNRHLIVPGKFVAVAGHAGNSFTGGRSSGDISVSPDAPSKQLRAIAAPIGDTVALSDEAILEIYNLDQNNKPVAQGIRFLCPTTKLTSVFGTMDEMLTRPIHIS